MTDISAPPSFAAAKGREHPRADGANRPGAQRDDGITRLRQRRHDGDHIVDGPRQVQAARELGLMAAASASTVTPGIGSSLAA